MEPLFFISHFSVKPGHAEAFREMWADVVGTLETSKPATTAQVAYLSEDGSRLSIVHVFPDADALAAHFLGADERSRAVYEHIEPAGWEIYGRPHDEQLAGLRSEAVSAGVTLTVVPDAVGGFLRTGGH
jgi:quinol monooxygenase YgiN